MQNVYSHLPMVIVPGTITDNSKGRSHASLTTTALLKRSLILLFVLTAGISSGRLSAQICTCPGTNLVQNSSWENGTANWNWSGGNLTTGTNSAQCGTNAGHFQITNTGSNWVSQHIGTMGSNGISAGTILTLKVYAGTHNPSYYHQVGISYFTSNWTYISGNYTEVNSQLPTMEEYTVLSTVPSNAYYITVEKGGNGDWIKTDRWCVSVSQCDPDNSSAPPYCAPQPNCAYGNNFLWSQNINSSDGSPSVVRLVCSSQLSYTIPGSYPAAFNGPVHVNISDVVSWDGYSGRNSVTQQNEKWRIVFKKNGNTVYASPYTNDVPDLQTQGYWRGSLGTTAFLPEGADQIILEHWAAANNTNCSNGPNSVVPVSFCIGYTPVTCSNVTNGGQIASSQNSCLATYDPAPFTNVVLPSGGSGTLEYVWLKSTTTCIAPNGFNDSEWEIIPGSNSSTYDTGPLNQNTCYVRKSRRSGCPTYDGLSNVVSVTVSGPAVQIASPLTLVKDRVISNEFHCASSAQRVLWIDCLLDNSPGGTSENAKYWKIISGGTFREYCDGTAYFEMRVQNLVTATYQMDLKVVLSGRTYTPPVGSPHIEGCTSSASSDWYYYTNMTGTITGVNGLAGALLSIDKKMPSFQVGTNASLYASPGQFGASGWLIYNVISHPASFKLKGNCNADFNFLLSGGALTANQSTACSTICTGESTTLTANGGGGNPGYTYSWDNNLGTGQTKTVNPGATTTYKVTITDSSGCSSFSQTTIYVNPQPVLNAGQDVEICQGQTVLLTVNASNGTPPYTYTWSNPPGGTGASKTVSPTSTTNYTVTVTDAKGCTDTDVVTVTVNPNPLVSTNTTPVCSGNALTITSTPSGGTPGYSYVWSGPNGFSASTQNVVRSNASSSMSGTYQLIIYDSNGCSASSSITATVDPKPSVSITGMAQMCIGDNLTLSAQGSAGTPGYNFAWSGPGGFTANGSNLTRNTATIGMAGTYTVTVTDSKGCTSTASQSVSITQCEGEICFIGTDNNTVHAKTTYQIVYNINPALNKVKLRTTFSKNFVDNTYGTTAIGWPGGHSFGNLTGSDHLQMALYDANNVKKLELKMDYLTSSGAAPSGYKSLGVTGGDGSMIFGNASDVINVVTSLDQNFNGFGYVLTTNSPLTDESYTVNPTYPNWIYDVWYEAEVKLSAFGSAGFGTASITGIHASPSKTGNNTEPVEPGDCCILFAPEITGANFKCNDSPNPIQLSVSEGNTFLWSTGATTQTISVNPAQNTTYSVTVTSEDNCVKVLTLTVNVIDCEGEICFIGTNNNTVSAKAQYQIIYNVNPALNKVKIRTTFSKNFVDNTYGDNAIGWSGGHSFGNLTGSDHLQIALYDANNVKKLELKMDYLTSTAAAPSGYKSLGVSGGDGSMIFGNESDVLNVVTSLDQNFNTYGYVLTTNSPETNDDYIADPNYPNWIYDVWYEAEIKLSAFGAAGFGTASITGIHASPSKTGNNTELVTPGDCCVLFNPEISGANFKCIDSPNSIQLSVSAGATFLWSTGATTQSITVNPSQNTTYYVTVTDEDDCSKVLSQEVNIIDCEGEICFVGNNEVSADVKWTISYSINENENKVKIKTTFSKNFVDNTYGTNAIGWSGGHTFGNLTGSDHLIISLYDAANVKKMEMKMDYITASTDAPSGYRSLGVLGGDGSMIFGNASDVIGVRTSLDMNFNDYGYVLTTNSPATDANYTINPTYPNWIYEVWYEAEVKLSAFGAAGFGTVDISGIHASPSKTGNNTEEVDPGPCCEFEAYITGDDEICQGQTATLTANVIGNSSLQIPTLDETYIDENNPSKNYGNCKEIIIGTKSGKKRRGLVTFDISSIPAGSNIVSATVFLTKTGGTNTSTSIGLYTMNSGWQENTGGCAGNSLAPNWTQKSAGLNWSNQGGDFNNTPIATSNVAGNGLYSWNVLSTVQGWVSGNTNNGLLIKTTNEGVNDEFKFATSEEGNVSERPYLNVVYTLPASGITYLWSTGQTTQTINVSPAQTTTYTITITAPDVCDEGEAHLTVNVTQGPSVNVEGNNQLCRGESTTLTANSATATQYLWSNGSTQPSIIVSPIATTNYSVTVTDANGCTSSSSILVSIYPDLDIDLFGNNVCSGGNVVINLNVNGGTPNFSYSWQGPNGFSSTVQNINRLNANTSMSGIYSVTVTDSRGCVGTANIEITVYPNPLVTAYSNSPICEGETIQLNANPVGGTPGYTYQWTGPNGYTSTIQNPTRTNATASMAGTYSVTVTDFNGCTANTNTSVSLSPPPVSGIQGPATTCAKEPVLFQANPPAGPGTVYNWTFNGGNPANATGPSAVSQWDVPGEYLITLYVNRNGCDTVYTKSIIITQEVFSIAGPDKEICQGGNVTLNGQGPAGANFSWTVVAGDGTSIDNGGTTMNVLVSPLYTTVYRLTVSQNGCVRTDEVTVLVNVNLNPIADAGPPLQLCAGTTAIIGGNPTGTPPPGAPNTPLGYIWSPASGLNAITIPNPTLTLNTPGSYTYQVIVIALNSGCTDTALVTHVIEPKAKVGDFVWEDLNGNGRQDINEPGINQVSVSLHNVSNNALVASTSTANRNGEAGYYEFEVCKGNYYIVFGDVPNYNRTPKNAPGTTNANDSDANANTGRSDNFTLNAGDNNQTIDAGYYRPARLGDFVWEDLNVNGIQDNNEPGISGVIVRLLDENGLQLAFTTTNINGLYFFNNLRPGNYIVKFDTKAGYVPTTKDAGVDDAKDSDADPVTGRSHLITLLSGQEDLTIDAGYYRLARIGDFVWEDTNLNNLQDAFEPVLQNVIVTLTGTRGTDGSAVNLNTTTDNTGFYDFSNLTPGTYTVSFTRPSSIYLSVVPNAGADNIDSDADPVTGQTGPYNLQSGEYNNTVDAGYYRCARVGDFVWIDLGTVPNIQDAGDIGINNVEVRLYQSGTNTLIGSQLTRNSPIDGRAGYYLFECIPPGQYYVKVIKPNPSGTIVRYDFVQPNQGGNDMLDSDVVDFLNGTTLTFTVGYAQTILDVDIGLITVLPVNVKDITGWWDKVKDVNEVVWTTAQEINNSHFIIERSFEGGRFTEVGIVQGNGTSTQDIKYLFSDANIARNGNYTYQVSQVDFDGSVNKIGVVDILVARDNVRGVYFYPNPTNGWVNVEISASEGDELSYEIFDMTGKLVRSFDVGQVDHNGLTRTMIDLSGYSHGVYYAKVKVGDQNFIQRIVKIE